jgi:hypothetical protein
MDFPGAENFHEVFHDWCAVDGYAQNSRVARTGRLFSLFTETMKEVAAAGNSTFQFAQSM